MDSIMADIAQQVLSLIRSLLGGIEAKVCLVVDGDPLPAKQGTHKTRGRKSYQHLKLARKLVRNYCGLPSTARNAEKQEKFLARLHKCASGWVRWWGHLKVGVATKLSEYGCVAGFPTDEFPVSVVMAPYEADPKVVEIASVWERSLIISTDGDLHVYPFADNAIVSCKLWIGCFLHVLTVLIFIACYSC
jgi:hypothetical protein